MRQNFHYVLVGVVISGASCALHRNADVSGVRLGPPPSLVVPEPAGGAENRVIDIQATQPAHYSDGSTGEGSGEGDLGTPPPVLTGVENLGVITPGEHSGAAGSEAPFSSNPPAIQWRPVASAPVAASLASVTAPAPAMPNPAAAGHRGPDSGTLRALATVLPPITGASLMEPFMLTDFTATPADPTASHADSEVTVADGASTSIPRPATSPIVAPHAPVPVASSGFTAGGTSRLSRARPIGDPESPPHTPAVRLLSSEHEAE
jgi:hypothetical protein